MVDGMKQTVEKEGRREKLEGRRLQKEAEVEVRW